MELTATAVFDNPTPKALAAFIAQEVGSAALSDPTQPFGAISRVQLGEKRPSDAMVVDALHARLSSDKPSLVGDGFHVDVVPFNRWDIESSKTSQRLGGRFARYEADRAYQAHDPCVTVCLLIKCCPL